MVAGRGVRGAEARRRAGTAGAVARTRSALRERLEDRRAEIEQAIVTRVFAIADPADADPAYRDGLRAAVAAALEYAFEAIERGEEHAPPVPPALLVQARVAARNRIDLDTVLRRYLAGYALLGEFLIAAVGEGVPASGAALQRLLRGQAALLDRLLAAVAEEYARGAERRFPSAEARQGERIERLLDGEPIELSGFRYDFEACHLGLIARGPDAASVLEELTRNTDGCVLSVWREPETVWAWLGARRGPDPGQISAALSSVDGSHTSVALGEPGSGLSGWRLTHRQARAALPVARRGGSSIVRYAEVALLATILRDDLLAASLRDLYLTPLAGERDGGADLRETLRAYFAASRNVSSAAAALGVNRNTIASRLRVAEDRLGRPLSECGIAVEAALQLAGIEDQAAGSY